MSTTNKNPVTPDFILLTGNAVDVLSRLPSGRVHVCVTSPPYFGLRSYPTGRWDGGDAGCDHRQETHHQAQGATSQRNGSANVEEQRNETFRDVCGKCGAVRVDDQLGLEKLHDCAGWATNLPCGSCFICRMVAVFREVRRVLRDDGTCWVNMGDSYATGGGKVGRYPGGGAQGERWGIGGAGDREANQVDLRQGTPPGRRDGGGPRQRMRDDATEGETAKERRARERREAATGSRSQDFDSRYAFYDREGAPPRTGAIVPLQQPNRMPLPGLKPKDMCMIPARLALALQADGWYLRSDIIWHKPSAMPSSVQDRPTPDHEYLFLLAKSQKYYYDGVAIQEPCSDSTHARISQAAQDAGNNGVGWGYSDGEDRCAGRKLAAPGSGIKNNESFDAAMRVMPDYRNKRTVWTINPESFSGAHFATYPTALVRPAVRAGSSAYGCCSACGAPYVRTTNTAYRNPGNRTTNGPRSTERRAESPGFEVRLEKSVTTTGWQATCKCDADVVPCTVLDNFSGSGTTGVVALQEGREYIGIDLSGEYNECIARPRLEAARAQGRLFQADVEAVPSTATQAGLFEEESADI